MPAPAPGAALPTTRSPRSSGPGWRTAGRKRLSTVKATTSCCGASRWPGRGPPARGPTHHPASDGEPGRRTPRHLRRAQRRQEFPGGVRRSRTALESQARADSQPWLTDTSRRLPVGHAERPAGGDPPARRTTRISPTPAPSPNRSSPSPRSPPRSLRLVTAQHHIRRRRGASDRCASSGDGSRTSVARRVSVSVVGVHRQAPRTRAAARCREITGTGGRC